MNKEELVDYIKQKANIEVEDAQKALDLIVEEMGNSLNPEMLLRSKEEKPND